jgi:plastocyanin
MRKEHFFPLTTLKETMTSNSRIIFWSACAIMLVLSCSFAGCTSAQSPPATTPATLTPAGGSNQIAIKNFAFSPADLTIKAGTPVTWTNQDGAPHQIASEPGTPVAFESEILANGVSYQFTFTQAGTYSYYCTIHPSMKGTIIVQS